MRKNDVFISYRRKSNQALGQIINEALHREGHNPFFDTEVIKKGEKFPDRIKNAMNECLDCLVLIQDDDLIERNNSQEEDYYLEEIELAIKNNKHIIPIFTGKYKENHNNEYVKELLKKDGMKINEETFKVQKDSLFKTLISVPDKSKNNKDLVEKGLVHERIENKYDTTRFKAEERLSVQQKILKPYNDKIFNELLEGKKNIDVLDLGSNNGNTIMLSIIPEHDVRNIIGLEYSEKMYLDSFKYKDVTPFKPYRVDVEAEDFVERLSSICKENDIDGFDLIVVSFLLLHLKKPGALIRRIRKFLKKDGYIFIRDVDDLQTVSYPDKNGIVETFKSIDAKLAHTGYRLMGRELYTHLKQAEYHDIRLIGEDISTAGRDYEERLELMDMNFSYIIENIVDMIDPNTLSEFNGFLDWAKSHYEDLEALFSDSTYYYKPGIVAITAKR